jgi:hypothetical protein
MLVTMRAAAPRRGSPTGGATGGAGTAAGVGTGVLGLGGGAAGAVVALGPTGSRPVMTGDLSLP